MKKQWVISKRTKDDLIEQLLDNRGVIDYHDFLYPGYTKLHDPKKLKNMDRLVKRLLGAIKKKEKIGIFGDYDHDGTPAAALLSDGITSCGGNVALVYIPTREEGYSISRAIVDLFKTEGVTLLITVDCGITNKKEVDYATFLGIDCVVIDHHVVQDDKYPDAAIVVNPKQPGDTYPFKELCACGLAFKTIQALGQKTGKISNDQLKWYLDLVAISTICDMVPLIGENRVLAHFGLMVLRQTKRPGLQQLYETATIDKKSISTYTVGFIIGPRLNAPGRMERASLSYELLVTSDKKQARELAVRLEELNRDRQKELQRVLEAAEEAVTKKKLHQKKVIVVSGDGWSDGVVGLVAGRITEKYSRPSIVLAGRADGLAKGSARSVDGFHLVEALQECEEYLIKYGGHEKAAGLTLAKDQLVLLYDKIIEVADKKLSEDSLKPKIKIDTTLRTNEINLVVAERLTLLEPHGLGNSRPIFLIENVEVIDSRTIGKDGQHLKLRLLIKERVGVDAVAFNLAKRKTECEEGKRLDVVGILDVNEWQNRKSVQFKVLDWRAALS